MSDSGQKINYSLRPAKCVERKVLCELLSKFDTPVPIHEYRYIGFGSFYYSDFVLFHSQLNLEKMISIERSLEIERYNFNKPFKCITLLQGTAANMLTEEIVFSKEIKDIVWLDYDDAFCKDMVVDLITAVKKVSSGSFLFTSFNRSILSKDEDSRYDDLKKEFEEFLPVLDPKRISEDTISNIIYRIIDTAVQNAISERNIAESSNLEVHTFFFIKYRDGAPMLTVGYYLSEKADWDRIQKSKTAQSPWFTVAEEPQSMSVPCFTKAEIREINRFLPGSTAKEIHENLPYLKESDIEKYIKIYKYYPNFLDASYYV